MFHTGASVIALFISKDNRNFLHWGIIRPISRAFALQAFCCLIKTIYESVVSKWHMSMLRGLMCLLLRVEKSKFGQSNYFPFANLRLAKGGLGLIPS